MISEGVVINGAKLSEEEYIVQLKNKIVEEAKEVQQATDLAHLKMELADVLEVIHAIAEASSFDLQDIEEERIKKRNINGYFQANNYVNYIEVAKDNHVVIEYLENKNRPVQLKMDE